MKRNCEITKEMYHKSGIYSILNKENKKIYVGSTCSSVGFGRRWKEHKTQLKSDKHSNIYLQYSYNKYGEKSFEFVIIEECIDSDLLAREQYWIDYYCSLNRVNGYNLMGANRNIVSAETLLKMRLAKLGKKSPK